MTKSNLRKKEICTKFLHQHVSVVLRRDAVSFSAFLRTPPTGVIPVHPAWPSPAVVHTPWHHPTRCRDMQVHQELQWAIITAQGWPSACKQDLGAQSNQWVTSFHRQQVAKEQREIPWARTQENPHAAKAVTEEFFVPLGVFCLFFFFPSQKKLDRQQENTQSPLQFPPSGTNSELASPRSSNKTRGWD